MSGERVLVTGGSGFVGAHCIVQLLDAGYRVRTTVRSLTREADVRAMLAAGGTDLTALPGDALEFAAADLISDAGWADAVAGCAFVLHVASPFPATQPKDENELIVPARDGALRVLRAARDAGVKRVVLTSSFAAVGYGQPVTAIPFTEENWTDVDGGGVSAYTKSKTIAERAAWDFIAAEGGDLELAVINPVAIVGPALSADYSSSIQLMHDMMTGAVPALPRVATCFVDVRDVALLHLRAMTHPDAAGQRFLASAGEPLWFPAIAAMLRERGGAAASRVPTRVLPDWLVRMLAPFNPTLRDVASRLGAPKRVSNEKARRVFGWTPISNEDGILATAESLARVSLVPPR